jgi:HEAT repeat protein
MDIDLPGAVFPQPKYSEITSRLPGWMRWWQVNGWRFEDRSRAALPAGNREEAKGKIEAFVLGALRHPDPEVRATAALTLARSGNPGLAEAAAARIEDKDAPVREAACLAAGILGARSALPALRRILEVPAGEDSVKIHAALGLGFLDDPEAAAILRKTATNPRASEELRAAAFLSLSGKRDAAGISEMVRLLSARAGREEFLGVLAAALARSGAVEVVQGKQKAEVAELLLRTLETSGPSKHLRQSVALALPALEAWPERAGAGAIRRLLHVLSGEEEIYSRGFLLLALGELAPALPDGPLALQAIRRELSAGGEKEPLAFAALAAGLGRDGEAVPLLRALLEKGTNADFRSAAALALGLLQDRPSGKHLLLVASGKEDPMVRGFCCIALGMLGCPEGDGVFPALRKIVTEDPRPEARCASALGLAFLGHPEACKALLDLEWKGEYRAQLTLILAAGRSRDPAAFPALKNLFEDSRTKNEAKAIALVAMGHLLETPGESVLGRIALRYDFLMTRFPVLGHVARLP